MAAAGPAPGDTGFWRNHLFLPVMLFAALLILVKGLHVDFLVADAWFDNAAGTFPARDAFYARVVLHDGGNRLIYLVAMFSLAVAALGCCIPRLAPWRRAAMYVFACIAVTAGVAAIGKQVTHMDCPWSLDRYGGDRPYVSLFSARPQSLPHAACFPGAHSAGAFALFAFYFVWRRDRPRRARAALLCAGMMGVIFATTQWIRGAHFVSHDVWSAMLAWLVCLATYAGFGRRLTK